MNYMGSDQYDIDHFNLKVSEAYDKWDLEHLYNVTNNLENAPADADFAAWNEKLDEFKPEPQDFVNWYDSDEECIDAMYEELSMNGWDWDLVDEEACYPLDNEEYEYQLSMHSNMYAMV